MATPESPTVATIIVECKPYVANAERREEGNSEKSGDIVD